MFERVRTMVFGPNTGPALEDFDIQRDETGKPLYVEAWQTGGASNLYLLRGTHEPLANEQFDAITASQRNDILMVIPAGSTGRRLLPDDVSNLVVLAEIAVGATQSQAATVRVYSEK